MYRNIGTQAYAEVCVEVYELSLATWENWMSYQKR